MTEINLELRKELVKEIPELLKCFQCGTCVSSCLAEKYSGSYSPRRKILMACYGQKDIIAKELWRCVTCNSCNERCPQEVNPYDVLIKLKNYALKHGLVEDEALQATEKLVRKTGRAMPVNERTQRMRQELGLEELKPIDDLDKLFEEKKEEKEVKQK
ncbi:MAG: 4Fe-4S dicluster domain-containing protein [Nanoarchaeota archaeon]|nr:4Fe-4S dicluster domain-containing protein [Nanoarchaeota archaeon]